MEVSAQIHAPAAVLPEESPRYPFDRLCGPQNRPESLLQGEFHVPVENLTPITRSFSAFPATISTELSQLFPNDVNT
jgi:hypothetical protein